MVTTSHERVGKGPHLVRDGLKPFVERELEARLEKHWVTEVARGWSQDLDWPDEGDEPHLDSAVLLRMMWEQWNNVSRNTMGFTERSMVSEPREVRNKWAHHGTFSSNDAYRALDSTHHLLLAISAPQAAAVE